MFCFQTNSVKLVMDLIQYTYWNSSARNQCHQPVPIEIIWIYAIWDSLCIMVQKVLREAETRVTDVHEVKNIVL